MKPNLYFRNTFPSDPILPNRTQENGLTIMLHYYWSKNIIYKSVTSPGGFALQNICSKSCLIWPLMNSKALSVVYYVSVPIFVQNEAPRLTSWEYFKIINTNNGVRKRTKKAQALLIFNFILPINLSWVPAGKAITITAPVSMCTKVDQLHALIKIGFEIPCLQRMLQQTCPSVDCLHATPREDQEA